MSDEVVAILRDHGVQVTAQRIAVLRAVHDHPHCSVDEVSAYAREQLGAISRQSVYNSLAALVDSGILRRIQPAGSPARFEDRVADNHHHLICRNCRALLDVDCAVDYTPCLTPSQDWSFEIDEAEVVYWGTCPQCRTTSPEAPQSVHTHATPV